MYTSKHRHIGTYIDTYTSKHRHTGTYIDTYTSKQRYNGCWTKIQRTSQIGPFIGRKKARLTLNSTLLFIVGLAAESSSLTVVILDNAAVNLINNLRS